MSQHQGGCQCGAVRYVTTGAPMVVAVCHCSMCRRASAAPSVAWAMFNQEQVEVRGELKRYASSAEAERSFCPNCGTQIAFTATFLPGLIDITVGSLDDPEALPPSLHYWGDRQLSWCHYADKLPVFPQFPPMEG
jgi:hypothetical protein